MKQGMQWPTLVQALALRPDGPPSFRLTGIGPPQPDNTDTLQQVGWNLAQLTDSIHVDIHYRGFVAASLADLDPSMLLSSSGSGDASEESEAVAVNSVFELHPLLSRSGAIERVPDQTERHETLVQWRGRMNRDGFEPVHLGSNAFKQVSMLLALFAGDDSYQVEEKEGYLTLGWHTIDPSSPRQIWLDWAQLD